MVAAIGGTLKNTPLNNFIVEDDDGDAKAIFPAFNKARIASPIFRVYDGQESMVYSF
ncbi:hypothetical protein [Cognaticolwellia beringensis]|uniref:hypothetical protein n=1 Tax=Cognaticolwellia beringensis TaxID=1967665 RepID=UPI001C110118|nr:hypothetical protein [Cognaticolwellia beringensis]